MRHLNMHTGKHSWMRSTESTDLGELSDCAGWHRKMNKDSKLITDWENEQNYGRQTGPPVCRDQEIQKMTKYRKSGGLPDYLHEGET